MTAQPSSQAEREDVAREVLAARLKAVNLDCDARILRTVVEGDTLLIDWEDAIAAMLAFNDREHAPEIALSHPEVYDLANATPRSMPEEVVEAPSEDWLADVIDDSLDMDWTGRVGARAIIARWSERHD